MKSKLKITFALLPVVTALSGCGTDGIAAGVAAAAALTVAIADNWDEISNSPELLNKDLSEVSSKRICFYAKDSSTNNWTTEPNFQGYVNEAKKRGLQCGEPDKVVATIDSETSRSFKSKSDASICEKATWADGSGWNYSRHEYVAEAQNRGLGCEANIASIQNNSSKNTSSRDIDVSHMKDTELCRNATHSTPPQWKPIHMPEVREALSRGLHCDVSLVTNVEDTTPYIHKKSNHDIAIIIGNRTYSKYSTDIPDVDTAQFDAIAFKQFAKDYLQISDENIIYIPDAKTTDLLRVFGNERDHRGLAYRMIREDISNLYVYYSGHGAPSLGESPLLIPTDASAATFEIQGLSLSTLYNNLEKLNAKSTTVILEACFTGASPNGFLIKNASPLFNPDYPDLLTGRNLTVYAASQDNQLASWLPDKSNGLFTHYFLKAMRGEADQQYVGNNDGKVSNAEIREYLHHTMSYEAKRHYGRTQVAMIPNEPASWTTETE